MHEHQNKQNTGHQHQQKGKHHNERGTIRKSRQLQVPRSDNDKRWSLDI